MDNKKGKTYKVACAYCGKDRTNKGSLIYQGKVFCNDNCFEEWHLAIMLKASMKYDS